MKELIEKIEHKNNQLSIAKSKVSYPQVYPHSETEIELLKFTTELLDLKKEAIQETKIETQRSLIFQQLSEYIGVIEKEHQYPFSIKQGLSFELFYISPLINIKNIVFFNQNGISGVIYNLTLNEKDAVKDKEQFLYFLKNKKIEAQNLNNLAELYDFYTEFRETIIKDFC
ncbi:hypothetical protein [Flavobacterium sp. PL02]|uniref:hypothetical protein n=1 Tax=Flavobacterium sp. PL02 TaxID=3088354 RepID=UPI002B22740E|nr:hypothetical protein [Flavobacterium sp. PL02]MEA9412591.1 hypothetical protein [Flavobacterium sp. PL02]